MKNENKGNKENKYRILGDINNRNQSKIILEIDKRYRTKSEQNDKNKEEKITEIRKFFQINNQIKKSNAKKRFTFDEIHIKMDCNVQINCKVLTCQ